MQRVIVDYHNLTPDILKLLRLKYPDGYTDRDMIVFKNSRNETIKAIEVTSNNKDYLIKVSKQLDDHFEDFLDIEEINLNPAF